MSGVQQVEAAAGGDDRAVFGADPGGQGAGVVGVGECGERPFGAGRRHGGRAARGDEGRGGAHRALDGLAHQRAVGEQPGRGGREPVPAPQESPWWAAGAGTRRGCSP